MRIVEIGIYEYDELSISAQAKAMVTAMQLMKWEYSHEDILDFCRSHEYYEWGEVYCELEDKS